MVLTLACLLDGEHELINPRTGDVTRNVLIGNEDFVRKFQNEIDRVWEDGTIYILIY